MVSAPVADVGLGTAYERWAIYRRVVRWLGEAPPATALEGPIDGMAGMAGLHLLPLARRGTRVSVVLTDAAARDAVREIYARAGLVERLELLDALPTAPRDLVLGFNFAPHVDDWRAHLAALAARARHHLLVVATHPASYGVLVRRVLRRLERERRAELFEHPSCRPEILRAALRAHGEVIDEAYVDCPWWPDLFVSTGETLASATLARLGRRPGPRARSPFDAGPADFPFAHGELSPALRRALSRHPRFEGASPRVAGVFAHHRAYLVRRMDLGDPSQYP